MSGIVAVVIVLLIVIFGSILLLRIGDHKLNVKKANYQKIKFSDWATWYFLNPDVWQIHYLYKGIVSRKDIDDWYCFNFIDELKFIHFIKEVEKENTRKERNEKIIDLLEKVQKDIKSVKEKSNKEIDSVSDTWNKIVNRDRNE